MEWKRIAVYWAPCGTLGKLGAEWLGWDLRGGREVDDPVVEAPGARLYGFHATLKPPFRLAAGCTLADLRAAAKSLFATLRPVDLGHLEVDTLGDFCALRPMRTEGIAQVAAAAVTGLDGFRATPAEEELARRRASGLTARQSALLDRWGYPFVLDEFRPHLTLSGAVPPHDLAERARAHFAPVLDPNTILDRVSIVGEDALGRFHLIEDLPLGHGEAAGSSIASAVSTVR